MRLAASRLEQNLSTEGANQARNRVSDLKLHNPRFCEKCVEECSESCGSPVPGYFGDDSSSNMEKIFCKAEHLTVGTPHTGRASVVWHN